MDFCVGDVLQLRGCGYYKVLKTTAKMVRVQGCKADGRIIPAATVNDMRKTTLASSVEKLLHRQGEPITATQKAFGGTLYFTKDRIYFDGDAAAFARLRAVDSEPHK
jgi:hypothetical protein